MKPVKIHEDTGCNVYFIFPYISLCPDTKSKPCSCDSCVLLRASKAVVCNALRLLLKRRRRQKMLKRPGKHNDMARIYNYKILFTHENQMSNDELLLLEWRLGLCCTTKVSVDTSKILKI